MLQYSFNPPKRNLNTAPTVTVDRDEQCFNPPKRNLNRFSLEEKKEVVSVSIHQRGI